MFLSLFIALASAFVVGMILVKKTNALRAGALGNLRGEELYPYVEPYIRRSIRSADKFLVYISRGFVYVLLEALKRFTPWFHRWSITVEKKLLHTIAIIKGRGIIRERGAASTFIADLIQHKERSSKKAVF